MVDLDELKQIWTEHDKKLDESIRLNRELLRVTNIKGTRSALQRLIFFHGLEAIAWLAIVMALGNFIYEHIGTLRFVWPAAAADLFAIGMFAAMIRQIVAAGQIDYGKRVIAIQKDLEKLQVLRIRTTQWAVLLGIVVWAPFAVVAAKAFLGIDDYSAAWLWANVIFGLALIPLALWFSKRFSDRMGRSPLIQRLMKDLAGYNLDRAQVFLTQLSEFEK
jgi:hypothetical protein